MRAGNAKPEKAGSGEESANQRSRDRNQEVIVLGEFVPGDIESRFQVMKRGAPAEALCCQKMPALVEKDESRRGEEAE